MEETASILNTLHSPADLKKLPVKELPEVCRELRQFIIKELSENPGHLAASLGTIELTVALHYVLDTPYDRIVWDVGHQAYGHKILTGRLDQFHTNRQWGGLSGFPNPDESPYDAFIAGHASNSLSAALGMDIASRARGEHRIVTAVIGDGAMSGGLAYEALNNLSEYDNNVLVILNDNKYAIDRSIGGFSRSLTRISTSRHYNNFRWRVYLLFKKMGLMNDARKNRLLRFENHMLSLFSHQSNCLFNDMDIRYFAPVDGHDVVKLVRILNTLKNMTGPRVLHIRTVKGKGYAPAEQDATRFHAPGKFDIGTGESRQAKVEDGTQPIRFQDVFGQTLIELAEQNPRIVAVTPAMPTGCGLIPMMKLYPDRVFDVGIAEGHAVTFSAGLAREGLIPYCNIYSTFSQRAYDNIIHDVAIQRLPVVLCLDRAGLVGEDGVTHQGAFDIAALRCIPHLTIASPIDEIEFRNLLFTAQALADRPFIIRYPRGKGYVANWKKPMELLPVGQGRRLLEGRHLAIATIGPIGLSVRHILEEIQEENPAIRPALYDFIFIKPLDKKLVREIAREFDVVLSIENGARTGGFGSALSEALQDEGSSLRVVRLGLPDCFVEHGDLAHQREFCGLDEKSLRREIIHLYGNPLKETDL